MQIGAFPPPLPPNFLSTDIFPRLSDNIIPKITHMANQPDPSSATFPENSFVIVIGRQFGSGGGDIGKWLAEKLGVPYYDKSLLSEAAASLGLSEELFNHADERRPSLLRSLLHLNYGAQGAPHDTNALSGEGLYTLQSRVVREIGRRGSCVIVGRTADYLLRDHPRLVSLFIHAPLEVRIANIARRSGLSEHEAADLAKKRDSARESYYNYYTPRTWGKADNYHFSIDSSRISPELILKVVSEAAGIEPTPPADKKG